MSASAVHSNGYTPSMLMRPILVNPRGLQFTFSASNPNATFLGSDGRAVGSRSTLPPTSVQGSEASTLTPLSQVQRGRMPAKSAPPVKRPVGRPRKNPLPSTSTVAVEQGRFVSYSFV